MNALSYHSSEGFVPNQPTMQPPLPYLISLLKNNPYALANWLPFKQARCQDSPIADLPQADWLEVRKLLLCTCSKMPAQLRTKIEQTSIRLLKQQHPNPRQPITLVSVGSGGCYQELVYVAKLVCAGFNYINLVLIEKKSFSLTVEEITQLQFFSIHHPSQKQKLANQERSPIQQGPLPKLSADDHLLVTFRCQEDGKIQATFEIQDPDNTQEDAKATNELAHSYVKQSPSFLASFLIHHPFRLVTWLPFNQARLEVSPIPNLPQKDWDDIKNLTMCPCAKMPINLRTQIIRSSLYLLKKQHPNQQLPITVVSIGSGGCYQELVYIAHLVHAGFTNIHLVLIEKIRKGFYTAPEYALETLCKRHFEKEVISITKISSLERYAYRALTTEKFLRPDLLLLLDISDEDIHINRHALYAYCFLFFQEKNILNKDTVISYSDNNKNTINPATIKALAYAYCFIYSAPKCMPKPDRHVHYHLPLPNFPLSDDEKVMLAAASEGRLISTRYNYDTWYNM